MKVPLLDLQPQTKRFRNAILKAVTDVIDSTQYILGPEVQGFEEEIAAYCGSGHALGVSSGTDALLISLMALEIGPGDRVLTTPFTFFATMGSIMRVGARPVFVDIEPGSMNADPEQIAEILEKDSNGEKSIKALMPVHLFGQCADMEKIVSLAGRYDVPVIEDAAQAIGAECPMGTAGTTVWKKAGTIGTMGCYSFFPSKNLGGIGDGGLVVTDDEPLAARLISLRNHGAEPKYFHNHIGGNFRLDPVQAAVLRVKLPYLNEWHQARRNNSDAYRRLFKEAGLVNDPVVLPKEMCEGVPGRESHFHHIYNQFVIRTPKRDALKEFLLANGIGCEIYYPLCLHQQKCMKPYGYGAQSFPEAEKAARECLALPIYPELQIDQLQLVVDTIAGFFRT